MNERRDTIDFLFKKALALEKYHPEEAIKCYTAILEYECKTQREQLEKNRIATNVYGNKGIALERLGRHKEAKKCFAVVTKSQAMQKTKDVEIVNRWFEEVWSRIIKNEGKLFKTKTGVVFSYRITKYKKSIMPQYRLQHRLKNSAERIKFSIYSSTEEFPIIGESRYISKTLIKDALDIVPVIRPIDLKRYLDLQSLDTAQTHLWGILHDERISKSDW